MSTENERKAVTRAQAILNTWTSGAARNAEITAALRDATRLVTTAMARGFAGEAALNSLRGDAANALSAVAGASDKGTLAPDAIATAKRAAAALLAGFDQQSNEPEKIYVDPAQPATLCHGDESVECHTLEEAVLVWMRLPEEDRRQASIKVNVAGGPAYKAEEIERLHVAPKSH